jgi:hypothetical protein
MAPVPRGLTGLSSRLPRDQLVAARETEVWALLFPHEEFGLENRSTSVEPGVTPPRGVAAVAVQWAARPAHSARVAHRKVSGHGTSPCR